MWAGEWIDGWVNFAWVLLIEGRESIKSSMFITTWPLVVIANTVSRVRVWKHPWVVLIPPFWELIGSPRRCFKNTVLRWSLMKLHLNSSVWNLLWCVKVTLLWLLKIFYYMFIFFKYFLQVYFLTISHNSSKYAYCKDNILAVSLLHSVAQNLHHRLFG